MEGSYPSGAGDATRRRPRERRRNPSCENRPTRLTACPPGSTMGSMTTTAAPPPPGSPGGFHNAAEWLRALGGVPLERIVFDPPPGTATEADLLRLVERDKRLCE